MWNTVGKIFPHSELMRWMRDMGKKTYTCYVCGKVGLSKDETGITRKLIDKKTEKFYCLDCLADYLEVTKEELQAKIDEFKEIGRAHV